MVTASSRGELTLTHATYKSRCLLSKNQTSTPHRIRINKLSHIRCLSRSTSASDLFVSWPAITHCSSGNLLTRLSSFHQLKIAAGPSWAASATTARRTANARSSSSRGPRSRMVVACTSQMCHGEPQLSQCAMASMWHRICTYFASHCMAVSFVVQQQ